MATTKIYLISPPPIIAFGINKITAIKKSNINIAIAKEYIFSFSSKKPKVIRKRSKVPKVILGILYLVQSKYDNKIEKI